MIIRFFQSGIFKKRNQESHSQKHYEEYKNDLRFRDIDSPKEFENRYNQIGIKLSKIRVDKSNAESPRFVGYIAKDNRLIKYDKKTWDYLVISSDGKTIISLHKKNPKEYKRVLKKTFLKEFDYNTDMEEIK